jgi:hypothetical protein
MEHLTAIRKHCAQIGHGPHGEAASEARLLRDHSDMTTMSTALSGMAEALGDALTRNAALSDEVRHMRALVEARSGSSPHTGSPRGSSARLS